MKLHMQEIMDHLGHCGMEDIIAIGFVPQHLQQHRSQVQVKIL